MRRQKSENSLTHAFLYLHSDEAFAFTCHLMCLGKDSVSDMSRFWGEDLQASEPETV